MSSASTSRHCSSSAVISSAGHRMKGRLFSSLPRIHSQADSTCCFNRSGHTRERPLRNGTKRKLALVVSPLFSCPSIAIVACYYCIIRSLSLARVRHTHCVRRYRRIRFLNIFAIRGVTLDERPTFPGVAVARNGGAHISSYIKLFARISISM